jgi:hypothetical protein
VRIVLDDCVLWLPSLGDRPFDPPQPQSLG